MPFEGTQVHIIPDKGSVIAVEFIAPFTIGMSRGPEPQDLKLLTSRPAEFQAIGGGPCTLRIRSASGDLGSSVDEVYWKGWYMASLQPNASQPGLYTATFYDFRHIAMRKRLTLAYNVQWPDEFFRAETMTSAQSRWKCLYAAWDALEKFGFDVDRDTSTLTNWQKNEILPSNLGNSPNGGFAGVTHAEIVPVLLEQIRCDYTMTPEGKVRVVSRGTVDESPKLAAYRLIGGVVAERDIRWQLPRRVNVLFGRRMEGGWDYVCDSLGRTAPPGRPDATFNWNIENVMPKFDPTGRAGDDFTEMSQEVARVLGIGGTDEALAEHIRKRWFKPTLFPYKKRGKGLDRVILDSAETIHTKQWMDDQCRRCWRRVFRPTKRTLSGPFAYAKYFTGISLGRLDENGGTKSGGNVFMDYCRHLKWGRPSPGAKADPLALWFSENYTVVNSQTPTYDNEGFEIQAFSPAPFTSRWISAEKLIFEVSPERPAALNSKAYYPAVMQQHLNYGPLIQLASGSALRITEVSGIFKAKWRMRLIWNGHLSRDLPALAATHFTVQTRQKGRLWVEDRDAFANGMVESVDVRVDDVTANFAFSEKQLIETPFGEMDKVAPEVLLNQTEIDDIADHVAEQIIKTYEQNRAGVAVVAGVAPVRDKVWTGGLIYNLNVVIGDAGSPTSVTTQYFVQPEVRPITAKRSLLKGVQPKAAQDE